MGGGWGWCWVCGVDGFFFGKLDVCVGGEFFGMV